MLLVPHIRGIGHVELGSKKSQRDGSVEKDNRKVSSWQSEIVEKIMSSNIVMVSTFMPISSFRIQKGRKKKKVNAELEHSERDFNNQCHRIYEFFYNLLHKPRISYNLGLLNLRSRIEMRINEISFN
jgi:hypothetical protein